MLTMEENLESVLKEMFASGMHLGYSATSRHPKMKPYIYGLRNGVEIFDLEKTKANLDAAKDFIRSLGRERKNVLFVGTKKEVKEAVIKTAGELNMPFVAQRWVGGTLTNFKMIRARMDYFNDLNKKRAASEFDKYTKKERLQINRKIEKMEQYFGGLADALKGYPSAAVVIDPKHEKIAVEESWQNNIPVIALLNSDCDPAKIKYPVPANDNSLTSVNFFLKELTQAYKEGTLSVSSAAEEKIKA